jgi:ParB family chromosome partitioning protein
VSVKRLGKGLEALIRPKSEQKKPIVKTITTKPGVMELPLKNIRPNPTQPRRDFDESALDELVASIKEKGVLTPVTVREVEDGYELVAGERRWRASKKCRKRTIPAYIITVKNDAEMIEMALIENIQREDLNALEESEAYAVLNSKFEMSHDAIAKAVGKKRVTVSNSLRLLKLPPDIRKSLRMGKISAGHARAILQAKTGPAMNRIWISILRQELSVRAAESLVKSTIEPPKRKKIILTKKAPQVQALENQLIEILGTKVVLKAGKKGGTIEISYFSNNDLDRILDLINSIS